MSEFKSPGTKVRCTYSNCEGAVDGGIVDENMRPWHLHCARKVLTESGSLINFFGPLCGGLLIAGCVGILVLAVTDLCK